MKKYILFLLTALSSMTLHATYSNISKVTALNELKNEPLIITVSQYCDFLNTRAVTYDRHDLYDERMGGMPNTPALIFRTKIIDGYLYSVAPDQEDAPIHYVSDKNKERFFHWLSENISPSNTDITMTANNDCGCGGAGNCICKINFAFCPCN